MIINFQNFRHAKQSPKKKTERNKPKIKTKSKAKSQISNWVLINLIFKQLKTGQKAFPSSNFEFRENQSPAN